MGKGAPKPQQQTEQNINQSALPAYAKPFFMDLMTRGEAESKREYTPYEGQRLANENSDITAAREKARQTAQAGMPGYDAANAGLSSAMARTQQGMNYTPEMFDSTQAQKYMSPYIQNVLDVQKSQALLDFNRGQGDRNFAAQQAGAFGGSRQGVQQALAGQGLQRDMQRIQAEGQQKAFESAQQQFGADRDARFSAEKMGLGAADAMTQQSKMLAQLGEKARAGDIESAQLLEKIGKDRQAREQAGLDIGYEDFVRQRDQPREDLTFFSSLLRGVPVSPSTESSKFQQYDPIKDLLGTGIAGLGLYKGITG